MIQTGKEPGLWPFMLHSIPEDNGNANIILTIVAPRGLQAIQQEFSLFFFPSSKLNPGGQKVGLWQDSWEPLFAGKWG